MKSNYYKFKQQESKKFRMAPPAMEELPDEVLHRIMEAATDIHRDWAIRALPAVNRRFKREFYASNSTVARLSGIISSQLEINAAQCRINASGRQLRDLELKGSEEFTSGRQ